MKTIAQVAKEAGKTKQTIRNWLKLPQFKGREVRTERIVLLPDDLSDELIRYSQFNFPGQEVSDQKPKTGKKEETVTQSEEPQQVRPDFKADQSLIIETMSSQIEQKDRQIERLMDQVTALQELLRNEQTLHLQSQKRADALETQIRALQAPQPKHEENTISRENDSQGAQEEPVSRRKSLLNRLFGD